MKLIIFDLDGVLVDLREVHYKALNEALTYRGYEPISRIDHKARFNGLPTKKKLDLLLITGEEKELVYQLKERKTAILVLKVHRDHRLQIELGKLKKDGYILACASNSIRQTVKNALLKTGLMEYIDFYFSNQDVIHPKPSPEIYLRCMIAANVAPIDTTIIEDSPIGQLGAEQTGAIIITVNSPKEVTYELIT